MSGSRKIKRDTCKACENLHEQVITEYLHIIEPYNNTNTACEVITNFITFLKEQNTQHNKKVNFCIFAVLIGVFIGYTMSQSNIVY